MDPSFRKPAGVFSSDLTSKNIYETHQSYESQIYEKAKQDIQKGVLRRFRDMKWTFNVDNLSQSVVSKLEGKIIRKGFDFKYNGAEYCPGGMGEDGSFTKRTLKISLSKIPTIEEEDGYFSDGWDVEFKASKVSEKIQKLLNREYQELAHKIEKAIKQWPGIHEYRFNPKEISPIVLGWLKDDLEQPQRGFRVNRESESCPGDISGSNTEFYIYWKIVNPKVNNYQKMEIYL